MKYIKVKSNENTPTGGTIFLQVGSTRIAVDTSVLNGQEYITVHANGSLVTSLRNGTPRDLSVR